MNERIKSEIIRFSKSRNDKDVFTPYTLEKFVKFVSAPENREVIAYAGTVTEDKIPVLFTGDQHLIARVSQRLGIGYPSIVVAEIIEAVENSNALGNILLESETMAFENGFECGVVALYIEALDLFCYLNTTNSKVHIATVMSGFRKYYANEQSDFVCTLLVDGTLAYGFEASEKLAKSYNTKYHGRKQAK